MRYKDIKIKQYKHVNYLWCMLDKSMSGETMALRVTEKINTRLKFLYQPHIDYSCIVWYPNLSKKLNDQLQVTQNKCIRFC